MAKAKAHTYLVRVITDAAEAVPGALRVGPPDEPERWRFGSYSHYWNEVAALRDHRHKLAQYEEEALDARPSQAAFRRQMASDQRAFIAMLEATQTQVASTYQQLAALGVLMHGYTANVSEGRGGQQPGLVAAYGQERRSEAHERVAQER